MASNFVGSRSLSGVQLIGDQDNPAIFRHQKLSAFVEQRCGPEVAALFAKPILSQGNGAAKARVDWYSQVEGEVRAINDLSPGGASALRERLFQRLSALQPLVIDPENGALVSMALNVLGPQSLVAVDEQPLILDWGMLPVEVADERARQRHAQQVFGEAWASFPAPAASVADWSTMQAARAAASGHDTSASLRKAAQGAAAVPPAPPSTAKAANGAELNASWRGPAIAAGVAGLVLLLISIPGVLRFPTLGPTAEAAAHGRELDAAVIAQMDRRRHALETVLDGSCDALRRNAATLIPPSPSRITVGPPASAGVSAPFPAQASQRAVEGAAEVPAVSAETGEPTRQMLLADRLGAAVVLVIAGNGIGSGFFVDQELIVTNRHVVEGAREIRIASRATGSVRATVVAVGGEGALSDFALLRVSRQAQALPLGLWIQPKPLESVVAAGFPGLYMETDPVFRRLLAGDASAARDLSPVLQTGIVSHLQPYPEAGVTLVLHSAEIAQGNSGGPLVDGCGRVIGVNSFGRTNNRLPVTARYALGTDGLAAFLASAGFPKAPATVQCSPRVAEASAEASRPAAPPAAAPAASPAGPPFPTPALGQPQGRPANATRSP